MKSIIDTMGIDRGGTSLRVVGMDRKKRIVLEKTFSSPKAKMLSLFLRRLWRHWKISKLSSITIGSKGTWTTSERKKLKGSLEPLAKAVNVLSDVELAFETHFHGSPLPAILLIAGTGSIALGKNRKGQYVRTGGLGPQKGDEGSGYWIGKEYVKRTNKKLSRDIKETAKWAPFVIKRSSRDPLCGEILKESHKHLLQLILKTAEKIKEKVSISLCLKGGLFENASFRRKFMKLAKKTGTMRRFKFIYSRRHPATMAAKQGTTFKSPKRLPKRR